MSGSAGAGGPASFTMTVNSGLSGLPGTVAIDGWKAETERLGRERNVRRHLTRAGGHPPDRMRDLCRHAGGLLDAEARDADSDRQVRPDADTAAGIGEGAPLEAAVAVEAGLLRRGGPGQDLPTDAARFGEDGVPGEAAGPWTGR